jgi:outer membrane lipoprotein SlyB
MIHDGTGSVRRRPVSGAGALGLAIWCSLALTAWAQSIKIPDFRQSPRVTTLKPGEACNECGRIFSVREIRIERTPAVPAAFQGGPGSSSGFSERNLVGAVIYLPLGEKSVERPFVGGVGTPEMRERFRESAYEISVRLDDGALRVVQRPDGSHYRIGDKVRLSGVNQIELIAN